MWLDPAFAVLWRSCTERGCKTLFALSPSITHAGGGQSAKFSIAIGLAASAYGMSWCMISPTIADFFGTKNFGTISSLVFFGDMASSAYNIGLAGPLYDAAYKTKLDYGNVKKTCCGRSCYEQTYTVAAIASFALVFLAILLHVRLKRKKLKTKL